MALGALASHGGQNPNGPIMGVTSLELLSSADGGFGGKLQRNDLSKLQESMIFKPNDELILTIPITLEQGIPYIEHVGLYLNNSGIDLKSRDYDTSIVYEKYGAKEITVNDPHGLFESANIKILEKGRTDGILEREG